MIAIQAKLRNVKKILGYEKYTYILFLLLGTKKCKKRLSHVVLFLISKQVTTSLSMTNTSTLYTSKNQEKEKE